MSGSIETWFGNGAAGSLTSPIGRGENEVMARWRQNSMSADGSTLRMQSAPPAAGGGCGTAGLAEQFGELFGDGAAEFFGVDDGDRAAVITRDVVTDADRNQFDRGAGFNLLDDIAQMPL